MPKDSRRLGRGIWGRLEVEGLLMCAPKSISALSRIFACGNNIQILLKRKGNLSKSNPIQSSSFHSIPFHARSGFRPSLIRLRLRLLTYEVRSTYPTSKHPSPACMWSWSSEGTDDVAQYQINSSSTSPEGLLTLVGRKSYTSSYNSSSYILLIQYLFIYIQHTTNLRFWFLYLSETPPFNLTQKRVGILDFRWIRISKSLSLPFPQVPHPKLKQRVCLTAELSNEPATVDFLRLQVGFPAALPLIFNTHNPNFESYYNLLAHWGEESSNTKVAGSWHKLLDSLLSTNPERSNHP